MLFPAVPCAEWAGSGPAGKRRCDAQVGTGRAWTLIVFQIVSPGLSSRIPLSSQLLISLKSYIKNHSERFVSGLVTEKKAFSFFDFPLAFGYGARHSANNHFRHHLRHHLAPIYIEFTSGITC